MSTPEPAYATTIARAAPEVRRLLTRSMINLFLIAAIALMLSIIWPAMRLPGIALAIAAAVNVVYCVLYLRRALLEFGGGTYRAREATSDVTFTAADVALAVPVDEFVLPGQTGPALVVIGTQRRRLVETNAATFGKPVLEAFVSDLIAHGVKIDHLRGRVSPRAFDRHHPAVTAG